MADSKFSELTELAGGDVAGDDILAIVDVSVPKTKKITKNSLVTALAAPAVRGISRGLISKYVTVSTADIDADEIIVTDSAGVALKLSAINLTVDMAFSGANGLDTGSEASSTWYYIWVIYNSSTTTSAGLLSVSATAPTMPSGYTYKALIGAVYNDSGGDFNIFHQVGKNCAVDGTATAFTCVNDSAWGSRDLSAAVPNLPGIVGHFYFAVSAGGSQTHELKPTTGSNTLGYVNVSQDSIASGTHGKTFSIPLLEAQTIYSKSGGGAPTVHLTWYSYQ